MLNGLKELNRGIEIYDVTDKEFLPFGRVITGLKVSEIINAASRILNPESGSRYMPTVADFEGLQIAAEIKREFFGTLPAQIGYCYGHNNFLNAAEWHFSS